MTAISCYWLLPSQWQAKQQGGPSKSNKIRTNPWPYNYRLSSQKRLLESCCFQGTFVHTPADNGLFSLSVCRDVRLGHPWLWQLPELPAWAHNQAVQIWPNVRASSPLPLVTSKPGKIPGCLFVSFCFIFKLESAQVWEASAQIREVHPPCSVSFKVNISEPDLLVLYLNHSLMQKGEKNCARHRVLSSAIPLRCYFEFQDVSGVKVRTTPVTSTRLCWLLYCFQLPKSCFLQGSSLAKDFHQLVSTWK